MVTRLTSYCQELERNSVPYCVQALAFFGLHRQKARAWAYNPPTQMNLDNSSKPKPTFDHYSNARIDLLGKQIWAFHLVKPAYIIWPVNQVWCIDLLGNTSARRVYRNLNVVCHDEKRGDGKSRSGPLNSLTTRWNLLATKGDQVLQERLLGVSDGFMTFAWLYLKT